MSPTRHRQGSASTAPRNTRLATWCMCCGILVSATACGPTLKESQSFTPGVVRALMFDDRCNLQRYFEGNPPLLRPKVDQNVSSNGPTAIGEATFWVDEPNARAQLQTLFRQFYRRYPALDPQKTIHVTLRYHLKNARQVVPIGAPAFIEGVGLDTGKQRSFELPYHPCIGAFFFGRPYYAARKRLMDPSAK